MGDEVRLCHLSENNVPPIDVNVLVVDDDATSLKIIVGILTSLKFKAVGSRHSSLALHKLRNNQGYFHLIVMDVHMPDIDGFRLKQIVDEEFALPVIMISVDNNEGIMEKALMSGVVRYILKPATPNDFKGIWQFAIAGMKGKKPIITKETGDVIEESNGGSKHHKESSCSTFTREDRGVTQKSYVEDNGSSTPKKTKVVWTNRLQSQFLEAINAIGLENAVPKRILEVMNVPGLTRENVASHLQKYRLFLKRVARMFAMVINNANDDKDVLLSSMASRYPSLMLKNIQEEFERILKQSGIRTSNLASNSISKSQLGYKLSKLWSNPTNTERSFCNKMNPIAQMGFSAGKINNLSIINKSTKPHPPYPNANDAYQLMSASNLAQITHEPSPKQPANPSGSVSYNLNKLGLGQKPSSSFSNYKARIELTSFQGRVGSSQMHPNGNGDPNAFDCGYASMNETNVNNVISSELLKSDSSNFAGGVVFATSEIYRKNRTSPMSMGGTNIGNIVVEPLCQPQQQQLHQISDKPYHQTFATVDNNYASHVTSNGSHFNGIDYGASMEGIYNKVSNQYENKGESPRDQDTDPADCTMHITTENREASRQQDEVLVKISLLMCTDVMTISHHLTKSQIRNGKMTSLNPFSIIWHNWNSSPLEELYLIEFEHSPFQFVAN